MLVIKAARGDQIFAMNRPGGAQVSRMDPQQFARGLRLHPGCSREGRAVRNNPACKSGLMTAQFSPAQKGENPSTHDLASFFAAFLLTSTRLHARRLAGGAGCVEPHRPAGFARARGVTGHRWPAGLPRQLPQPHHRDEHSVAFLSRATNLVPNDDDLSQNVFLRDLKVRTTVMLPTIQS